MIEDGLYYMVSIGVHAHGERILVELVDDRQHLEVKRFVFVPVPRDRLKQDLHHSCTVLGERHFYQIKLHGINERLQLVLSADFDNSLTQVVAKLIASSLGEDWKNLLD